LIDIVFDVIIMMLCNSLRTAITRTRCYALPSSSMTSSPIPTTTPSSRRCPTDPVCLYGPVCLLTGREL